MHRAELRTGTGANRIRAIRKPDYQRRRARHRIHHPVCCAMLLRWRTKIPTSNRSNQQPSRRGTLAIASSSTVSHIKTVVRMTRSYALIARRFLQTKKNRMFFNTSIRTAVSSSAIFHLLFLLVSTMIVFYLKIRVSRMYRAYWNFLFIVIYPSANLNAAQMFSEVGA